MKNLNPFHNLTETKKYPHARSHRTTFWDKMTDTFKVFYGNITPKEHPEDHIGIFDYLTFGLHYWINEPILQMTQYRSDIYTGLGLFLYGIWNIPRIIFSGVLTLICSPFVMIAQALSNDKGEALKDDVNSHNIKNIEYDFNFTNCNLPSDYSRACYKNSFFFARENNKLYWIDLAGKSHNIAIKDVKEIKKILQIGTDKNVANGFLSNGFYSKEEIDRCLKNPPDIHHTFREYLKAKELELDSIKHSKIILDPEDDQKLLLGLGKGAGPYVTEERYVSQVLAINLKNNNDLKFFKKLRKLNIGNIQANIENDEILHHKLG